MQTCMRYGRWTFVMFLLGNAGCSASPRIEVEAGAVDRVHTPASVELVIPHARTDARVCVIADGVGQPAQLECLGDGKARLWWIVSDLPAGRSRTYRLAWQESCEDAAPSVFAWKDSSTPDTKSIDLLFGDRPVLRYVHTPFDGTSEETLDRTQKPFHHVFDPDGSRLLTKGPGGRFSHHRGIFFGHNRIEAEGGPYDTWYGGAGDHQLHTRVLETWAGPVMGGHVVEIHWNTRHGRTLAVERRRVVAFASPDDEILIEWATTVEAVDAPVGLVSSDCHHGGVHFRAAQEVAENEQASRYLRPARWAELPADKEVRSDEEAGLFFGDLPWNAIRYPLGERSYTVAYISDPANPEGAEFSERLYGRFGEYFPWQLTADCPMEARYRFWVVADRPVTREQVQRTYDDLADPPRVILNTN